MSTASFDRAFIVEDSVAISNIKHDIRAPRKVTVAQRDHRKDAEKGIKLLKRRLSKSVTF
ncbi:hypothetical protein N5094_10905 [Shewanella putrefaciens]|uniref:hypothetical protein n=1 Tax=Shewanella putrefaciens TaxID=24 RepID=UPI0021BEEA93|nr:hypothetical protein [Shewanella putrefaciens]UXK06946.1 hypothetical protein N5094_10905 [Shewanella putrefaciens]